MANVIEIGKKGILRKTEVCDDNRDIDLAGMYYIFGDDGLPYRLQRNQILDLEVEASASKIDLDSEPWVSFTARKNPKAKYLWAKKVKFLQKM